MNIARFVLSIRRLGLFVGLVIVLIGCEENRVKHPVNHDIYSEVVAAQDGDEVRIRGYIDTKGICREPRRTTKPEENSCETAVFTRCPFAYVPILFKYCSENARNNCVLQLAEYSSANIEVFRDAQGSAFPAAAEVYITANVASLESGTKYIKNVKKIEVIPGSFDPVNINCAEETR